MKNVTIEADALDRKIGTRLRHLRKLRGLTQTDLGNALGVSFQQIQKYERGSNRISTSALILLARGLGVSLASLLGEQTPNSSDIDWALLSEDGAYGLIEAVSQIRSPADRRIILELARDLAESAHRN